MTVDRITTVAALAFAGFAIWWISRKPGEAITTQPGAVARQAGLNTWHSLLSQQSAETDIGIDYSLDLHRFKELLGK